LIAQALGDVHEQQVWRILQAHKIDDTSITDQFRGAAGYVDCIFARRETGRLPVQMPTKYETMLGLSDQQRRRSGAVMSAKTPLTRTSLLMRGARPRNSCGTGK
jgi:hypothetical protein